MAKQPTKEVLITALRDLLELFERTTGGSGSQGAGWTFADVKRLEEIRKLAKG